MNLLPTSARFATLTVMLMTLAACDKPPQSPDPRNAAAPTGVGAPQPATPAGHTRDLCTVLTDEEFRQATGFAVHARKSWPGEAPGCDWELKSDPQGLHRLSVNLRPQDGRKRFDFVSQSLPGIPNLGDAAAKTGGNINGTVWAVKGDALVTLNYSLPVSTTDPEPVVVPLVRLILVRL